MEPEKFDKKKFDDLFKNLNLSFTVPVGAYRFSKPIETVEQTIARLDEVDETVDAMTAYPTAERMLNDLFSKDK